MKKVTFLFLTSSSWLDFWFFILRKVFLHSEKSQLWLVGHISAYSWISKNFSIQIDILLSSLYFQAIKKSWCLNRHSKLEEFVHNPIWMKGHNLLLRYLQEQLLRPWYSIQKRHPCQICNLLLDHKHHRLQGEIDNLVDTLFLHWRNHRPIQHNLQQDSLSIQSL